MKKFISFKAIKIVSKPVKVEFRTSNGQRVSFKAKKDMPKTVKVMFRAKQKASA